MTSRRRAEILGFLYQDSGDLPDRLERILDGHRSRRSRGPLWTERDAWLITYPDQFRRPGEAPLRTLAGFFESRLSWLNGLHVLPFFPWSSDDGFAVVDYLEVDPRYGTWDDVRQLDHRLAVDAVINHLSAESTWFRRFLDGDPAYRDFFITMDPSADLSGVVRPRTTPLLTPFPSRDRGQMWVWTTFSADQVDLNYHNPEVLLRIVDVLLTYAERGASVIRLDAVAYLWKEPGTTCVHLPQTHAIVELFRSCLDETHPGTLLLTETNVPHRENLSYFGTGDHPEAHIVYQFPLAPLVLDAFATGDASTLSTWAADVTQPRADTTFLNFLASHDGVGVRPVEGILDSSGVGRLGDLAIASGGSVSERTLPDGSTSPYELNATWFDLLAVGYDEAAARQRHLASHTIMAALQGIPAYYVHSLFGTGNDIEAVAQTGIPREINRRRFELSELERRLATPDTRQRQILDSLASEVARRSRLPQLSPKVPHRILDTPPPLFGVDREDVRVLVNVSDGAVDISDYLLHNLDTPSTLPPFASAWLIPGSSPT